MAYIYIMQIVHDHVSGPDVRRWRFIVMGPTLLLPGARVLLGTIPLDNPVRIELDCERGRVVDEASLGRVETPFRELLLGAPEARFLHTVSFAPLHKAKTYLFLMTSVFSDSGRTTP